MASLDDIRQILKVSLHLGDRAKELDATTGLLGNLPEFDSMAVVSVVTALETDLGVVFDDDDISAENFETVGSLLDFVNQLLAE